MVAIAVAGAGNAAAAAGALAFPSTMDMKSYTMESLWACMQHSIFRRINNTAYTWGLVSSASEVTNRGAGAGAADAGGTLQVVVIGAVHEGRTR